MSRVWSCNEWDPLEEVIVGNPLHARFPTPDRSTQVAEFSDRSLAEIPRGPFPQRIIEETEEDLNEFVRILRDQGDHGQTAGDLAARRQVLHDPLGSPGVLQLLSPRHLAGRRRPDHRNAQRHPQPRPGDLQLSLAAARLPEVGRKVVQRPQAHAPGLAVRGRSGQADATQRRAGLRCGERPAFRPGPDLSGQRHRQRAGGTVAADDSRREVPGSLPQGRLLRQPHRLDARGAAPRPDALQSGACRTTIRCPRS